MRELVISVDSVGLFSSADLVRRLWEPALNEMPVPYKGMEIFNWRWNRPVNLAEYIAYLKSKEIDVAGIHFRTGGIYDAYGWVNRVKLQVLNESMQPTLCGMRQVCGLNGIYGLIHAPEARVDGFMAALHNKPNIMPLIKVENHAHIGNSGTALAIASELFRLGVNSGVMFDLFHEYSTSVYLPKTSQRVDMLVYNLRLALDAAKRKEIANVGIHDPEGTDLKDSLPPGEDGRLIRREVAALINSPEYLGIVDVVVIEGQRPLPDSVRLRPSRYGEVADWAKSTLAETIASGLIGEGKSILEERM